MTNFTKLLEKERPVAYPLTTAPVRFIPSALIRKLKDIKKGRRLE